jgi:hypothetical protein
MSMINSSDTIGIRTHDLPACSTVPQPTAPPRAPIFNSIDNNYRISFLFNLDFLVNKQGDLGGNANFLGVISLIVRKTVHIYLFVNLYVCL